jgi:kynurenine formamidase
MRLLVVAAPINIKGGDGGYVRVVALETETGDGAIGLR